MATATRSSTSSAVVAAMLAYFGKLTAAQQAAFLQLNAAAQCRQAQQAGAVPATPHARGAGYPQQYAWRVYYRSSGLRVKGSGVGHWGGQLPTGQPISKAAMQGAAKVAASTAQQATQAKRTRKASK